MRAPKKRYEGPYTGAQQWSPPDDEWLTYHYWTLEKSTNQIARELGCRSGIVLAWMDASTVRVRSRMEQDDRHSVRMLGNGNPAYRHGTGRGSSSRRCRKKLWASNKPEECGWCGVSPAEERLEAHHKNHNRRDEALKNLGWLCRNCHKLETHLWLLVQQKKVEVKVCEDGLRLIFPHLAGNK